MKKSVKPVAGQYRQGDVLITPVKIPETATRVTSDRLLGPDVDGRNISVTLALGEVTGHHHTVFGGALLFRDSDGADYIDIVEPSVLKHQEHSEFTMLKGDQKKVIRQREYVAGAVPRNVAD
jgi:hypothetical protein